MPMPNTEFWEPWVPQVGQRVRLVKRAECVCVVCGQDGHALKPGQPRRKGPQVGTVRAIYPNSSITSASSCRHGGQLGHRFRVEMDQMRNPPGCPGWAFAAIELEPLEDTDAPS